MTATALAIRRTALVTSVGLDAPSACAAIRARLTNPSETRFADPSGGWLSAHAVPLGRPLRGLHKLVEMAAQAIDECLADIPPAAWRDIPLLLCVAEPERPGRPAGLDDLLFEAIEQRLQARFAPASAIVPQGKVATAVALAAADRLLGDEGVPQVLVVATDSLITWPTLSPLLQADRLLTAKQSNGFIAGEAAGAVLLARPASGPELRCTGLGFDVEAAHLASGEPLRAAGMTAAIRQALAGAGCELHALDFRLADLSGEQYFFKEAALALARTLRRRKPAFTLWHPAECTGETGAASGLVMLAVAEAACRKRYAPGPGLVAHWANDGGRRAAAVLRYVEAA